MPPIKSPNYLFDCLNAINHKNASYKYDRKHCSAYMLLMWFSHSQDCLGIVNKINKYLFDIPDELVYTYLYKSVPKGSRFIKYDKGDKNGTLSKKQQDTVRAIREEYGVSKKEALTIFKRF